MNDHELLAQAAKAANCGVRWEVDFGCYSVPDETCGRRRWNPLANDGDALRLVLDLHLNLAQIQSAAGIAWDAPDLYAATRRAIVRAAAEIGRTAA